MTALRTIAALLVLAAGALVAWACATFLDEEVGLVGPAAATAIATVLAVSTWAIPILVKRKPAAVGLLAGIIVLGIGLPASTVWPGGITASRFGLTVVGACPIPAFDITIRASGAVGLRRKAHRITTEEVRTLVEPGLEAIIIGNGWQQGSLVDPGVVAQAGILVEVLRTEEAFKRYNALRAQGKRVALIAHTTC